jgi:hypothetical protein
MQLVERLMGFQNMLCVELYALWLALANTQKTPNDIHIFINNLNNIPHKQPTLDVYPTNTTTMTNQ